MKKVLFWGMTEVFQYYKNILNGEMLKGNIEPVAIVSREKLCKKLDGLDIIDKNDISNYEFDYLIIFAKAFKQIKNEAVALGVPENKIINCDVLRFPCFDFERYTSLIENPVSIITNDCFGGNVYHQLYLEFSSPFINFFISPSQYLDFLKNFYDYIERPLIKTRDIDILENIFLQMKFEDTEIFLGCNHDYSYEEFMNKFERRRKRINYDNLLFKMTIENDEQAEMFDALPLKNKVGFYYKPTKYESIHYLPYYTKRNLLEPRSYDSACFNFPVYVRKFTPFIHQVDILKMLTDKKDFMRAE